MVFVYCRQVTTTCLHILAPFQYYRFKPQLDEPKRSKQTGWPTTCNDYRTAAAYIL